MHVVICHSPGRIKPERLSIHHACADTVHLSCKLCLCVCSSSAAAGIYSVLTSSGRPAAPRQVVGPCTWHLRARLRGRAFPHHTRSYSTGEAFDLGMRACGLIMCADTFKCMLPGVHESIRKACDKDDQARCISSMCRIQASDPEDPWLHYEWGMTLLALGPNTQLKEASMHLEVSSALFTQASQDLLEAEQPASKRPTSGQPSGKRLLHLTQLDSKTLLTSLTALQAAMQPLTAFQDAAATNTEPAVVARACELLQRLCHVRLQAATLLDHQHQRSVAGGASSEDAQVDVGALQEAALAAQGCLQELNRRPGCAQHARHMREKMHGLK